MRVLLKNIGHIFTPDLSRDFGSVKHYEDVHLVLEDGKILEVLDGISALPEVDQVINVRGKSVLPGFVDAHTHPVFWQTREAEFVMRIQGKSYEEIAAAGGGIRNSVRRFREANKEDIKRVTRERVRLFAEFGVTTIEAKSGYGLSPQDEIKALEIIQELNAEEKIDLVPTFLGAHEIPDEYRDDRQGYIRLLIEDMIPEVAERKLAKYCDVFCEKDVFTVEETRQILLAAKEYGLQARIHADELFPTGGAELAAELGAKTADHLVQISNAGIRAMAEKGTIAVLLPGTTFFLGKDRYAPARKMIDAGCQIAVSTDFNPGSSATQNLQLMWTIAALKMRLLPGELLWATTIIPARSLDLDHEIGSIEPGKNADLVILDVPNLEHIAYHYGVNHTLMTLKRGEVIYKKN